MRRGALTLMTWTPWLAALLWAALALGCGPGAPEGAGGAGQDLAQDLAQAASLAPGLKARQARVAALCGLAAKAAATAPDLGMRFCAQALEQAAGLYDPALRALAERLRAAADSAGDPGRRETLAAAAGEMEGYCLRVWPLRLVAEAALAVAPDIAAQALNQALMNLGLNKGPGRDQDLAGLALVVARREPARARALAGQVADPGQRSRLWRELARGTNQPQDLEAAAAAARQIADPSAGARALAAAALDRWELDPEGGRALFAEARDLAGREPDPARQALALGEAAALLAQADPRQGLEEARALPALGGARFKALRRAALAYLGSDPERAKWALAEAARQVDLLPSPAERWQAWALLAKDAASSDPALARELIAQLPAGERLLRDEALSALVLAETGAGLDQALERVRRMDDPQAQVALLLRLAAIHGRQRPELGRALQEEALDLALARGGDQARLALAPVWAGIEPSKGVDIALGIGENVARARALATVAKILAAQGRTAGARWSLDLALEALAGISPKQMLDKVRLLGDMGREWAPLEGRESRRLFELGADAAGKMG